MASYGGERMYLVYEHKTNSRKLVPNGLCLLDEEGLVTITSANPDIRMTTKIIKPGCTSVDIYKVDLLPEAERSAAAKKAQQEKAGGQEEVPWRMFLGHEWEGHSFDELVILTPGTPPLPNQKANVEERKA